MMLKFNIFMELRWDEPLSMLLFHMLLHYNLIKVEVKIV